MTTKAQQTLLALLLCHLIIAGERSFGQDKNITIKNTCSYTANKGYDWTLYVDGDEPTIARIDSVEYVLHPTFKPPVRMSFDRKNKFALSSSGWGEFNVYVKVYFSDGTVGSYEHWLTLSKTASQIPADQTKSSLQIGQADIKTGNVATRAGARQWDWQVFVQADKAVLDGISYVVYTLHPTFPNPVRKVTDRGNDPAKAFVLSASGWGTFQVGVQIVFKDGRSKYLKHQLKF